MTIIKLEVKKLRKKVVIISGITLFLYVLIASSNLDIYIYDYQLQVWEKSGQFLDMVFPLVIMLLAGAMVYDDKKNNFMTYIGVRIDKKRYLSYKKKAILACSMMMIFVISFGAFIITEFLFPNVAQVTYNTQNFEHICKEIYIQFPILYVLILTLWRCVLTGIIVNFGFELSKILTNKVLIIVTPLLATLFLHFLFALLNMPELSVIYSFDPSALSSEAITVYSMVAGPCLFLIFSFMIKVIGEYYEKEFIYSKRDIL